MRFEQLISPFLDGELAPGEAGAVRSHLTACAACQREYEDLAQLSSAMKQMEVVLMPAPAGFKDSLMLKINEERVITPIKKSRWFNQSWRQVVAGAAAALLIIFSAVTMNSMPIVQLAEKTPVVDTVQPSGISNKYVANNTSTPEVVTAPDNLATVPPKVEGAISAENPTEKDNNSSPVVSPVQVASNVRSAPVFLNKERTIKTTLLKVRVADASLAQDKVLQIAGDIPIQTQNLGVQVNETGSYTTLKITVAKTSANSLINKLGSLGTVIGQEADNKDISTRYSETLYQYQSLVTQRATLDDASQKAQLDQRIDTLQKELTDLELKAEQETIVLWLEK
jgi:anti-sigma factor RsiW